MKKIIFIAALFFGTVSVSQARPGNLKSILQKVVTYSQKAFDKKIEGVVFVSCKLTKEGNLEILEMNASDPNLAKHVAEKLAEVPTTNFVEGEVHNFRFDFKIK